MVATKLYNLKKWKKPFYTYMVCWRGGRFKKARTHPIFKVCRRCTYALVMKTDQYTLEDFFIQEKKHNDLTFKFRDFRELIIP